MLFNLNPAEENDTDNALLAADADVHKRSIAASRNVDVSAQKSEVLNCDDVLAQKKTGEHKVCTTWYPQSAQHVATCTHKVHVTHIVHMHGKSCSSESKSSSALLVSGSYESRS